MLKDKKKLRFLAIMLIITVFISTFVFISYNVKETSHNCSGNDCSVCCQISICKDIVKNKVNISAVTLFLLIQLFKDIIFSKNLIFIKGKETLVSLKVKLSD